MACVACKIFAVTFIAFLHFATTAVISKKEVKNIDEFEKEIRNVLQQYQQYTLPKDNREYQPTSNEIQDLGSVDFVVVGVGTAGAIVANRLSEVHNFEVMAIEAGTFGNALTTIPSFSGALFNSPYNWGYESTPSTNNALGSKTRTLQVIRGKGVGGSTILNGLRYIRGNWLDWNNENHNWDAETMLNYYKKSENSHLDYEDLGFHGHDGPLNVEHPKDKFYQTFAVLEALNSKYGIDTIDVNGHNQIGSTESQMLTKNGRRISTGTAFINPILNKRKNLKLIDNALVTKIIINPSTKIAESVIYSKNGQLFKVSANKEVILCGGAINSPQLLMLSGIGPAEDLTRLNISVIQDLPAVGRNLIDHPISHIAFINFKDKEKYALPEKSMREHLKDFLNGKGMYTVGSGNRAQSIHKTKYSEYYNEGGDLICTYNGPYNINIPNLNSSIYAQEVFNAVYDNVDFNTDIEVFCTITHPLSRGSVTLKSSSPFDHPVIDLNHHSVKRDTEVLAEAGEIIHGLNEEAQEVGKLRVKPLLIKACEEFAYRSKEYWMCVVRQTGQGGFHLFNTCAMGPVVDDELKVHGIKNLRIVDASVITKLSGFPMAAVMAIAERASDLIKSELDEEQQEMFNFHFSFK